MKHLKEAVPAPSEHWEQVELIKEIEKLDKKKYPNLDRIFAIPNGGFRDRKIGKNGQVYSPTGRKMKAEGLKPGVPDLFLPVIRFGYAGLFIEMKKIKGGYVRKEQKDWINYLLKAGYRVTVARGWIEAVKKIKEYYGEGP